MDTDSRFIEQQCGRPGHQRAGEPQLLLHAAGELARQTPGKGGKTREVEQFCKQVGASVCVHAAQLRIKAHILQDRQVFVEAKALRHRSEEHTSELQSLMRTSYAVFCLKKKNTHTY